MSDRPKPSVLPSVLAPMTGRRLPGGCDDCDAYQVLSACPADHQWGAVYVLTVHHDDTCPTLKEVTG